MGGRRACTPAARPLLPLSGRMTTVREALRFSAILRQPAHVSRQEKLDYVEEVIKLLGMETYADAVVGVPGEGTNSSCLLEFDMCSNTNKG